ncbi:MAG TPA: ComEC/Rec2 family competence protein [Candidatus Eisenbacteria bacterium]|nr:ComEC/Rec2 family competence protein [Candidatus Eisenbacteria bacterium]
MFRWIAFRLPPAVTAWALIAFGHAALGNGAFTSAAETPCRAIALGCGATAILLLGGASDSSGDGVEWRANGRRLRVRSALLCAAIALLAAGAALGLEAMRRHGPLEVHPRSIRAELRGFVADASAAGEPSPTLRFDVVEAQVGAKTARVAATVRLRWPTGAPPPSWCVAGTPIAARGEVRPREDARNPGGSPPGRWLERDGIDATFDVEPGSVEAWAPPAGTAGRDRRGGARLVSEARRAVGRLIDAHAPARAAALARGMLLGDRVGIDAETRDSFRNAGTLHILSISGLHVCIVAGFVAAFARALGLAAGLGTAVELAALLAYVAFVGAPPPALRSALLWIFARGARLAGRGGAPFAGWGAAGLLLHLADPRLPTDLGFLLSFGAVLGLEAGAAIAPRAVHDARERAWRRLARGAATAVAAGAGAAAGTLPIEAAAFGALPVAGPVANLVVIPLTTLFLAEAILLALLGPLLPPHGADLLGGALGAAADLVLIANDHLGGRVDPVVLHGAAPLAAVGLAYAALLATAAVRGARSSGGAPEARASRAAAVALVLASMSIPIAAAVAPPIAAPRTPARIVALDVGQGDATLLVAADGTVVAVDAGPRSARRDEGRLTVEPALRAEGARGRIGVVASHGHRDHEGGILGLARRGWVDRVWENGGGAVDRMDWRRAVVRSGGGVATPVGASRILEARGVALDVHAPRAGSDPARGAAGAGAAPPNSAENDRSLVATARFTSRDGRAWRALFAGDLERDGEEAWLRGGLGRFDVLKVPHHGSRTSSTPEWVARIRPRVALVSAGERNRHRHPSPETLRRYRRVGALVLRTDQEGAIRVVAGERGLTLSTRAHPLPRAVDDVARSTLSPCFDFP